MLPTHVTYLLKIIDELDFCVFNFFVMYIFHEIIFIISPKCIAKVKVKSSKSQDNEIRYFECTAWRGLQGDDFMIFLMKLISKSELRCFHENKRDENEDDIMAIRRMNGTRERLMLCNLSLIPFYLSRSQYWMEDWFGP